MTIMLARLTVKVNLRVPKYGAAATVVKVTETGEIKKVYDFIVEGVNVFFVEGLAVAGYSVD